METKHKRGTVSTGRRRPPARRRTGSANENIIYTPPKPFNRKRFLLHLTTVIAVVLAVTLGMSIFFKVENVYVSGVSKYTAWDVKEASGIQEGENLITLSRAMIAGKVKTNLPYADDVRVGIKLPDTVNIEVKELDVVYALEADDASWWLISANGRVVDRTNSVAAKGYTQIEGVQLHAPEVGQQAVASEPEKDDSSTEASSGDETETAQIIVSVVTGSQRLERALAILQQLEANGIMGQIATIDVSDITNMQMWYGQYYQVQLGDDSRLDYKISAMKAAIRQMGQYQSGILDVSFTQWPDEVGYTPF